MSVLGFKVNFNSSLFPPLDRIELVSCGQAEGKYILIEYDGGTQVHCACKVCNLVTSLTYNYRATNHGCLNFNIWYEDHPDVTHSLHDCKVFLEKIPNVLDFSIQRKKRIGCM